MNSAGLLCSGSLCTWAMNTLEIMSVGPTPKKFKDSFKLSETFETKFRFPEESTSEGQHGDSANQPFIQIECEEVESAYYEIVFLGRVPDKLLQTVFFNKVYKCIDSRSHKGLLIEGGKGTGKSCLFYLLKEAFESILLASIMEPTDSDEEKAYSDYFLNYCKDLSITPHSTLVEILTDKAIPPTNKILFVEMGYSGRVPSPEKILKLTTKAQNQGWYTVISNSSGSMWSLNTAALPAAKSYSLTTTLWSECYWIKSRNFTPAEYKAFVQEYNIDESAVAELQGNPSYLNFFKYTKNEPNQVAKAEQLVFRERKVFVDSLHQKYENVQQASLIGDSLELIDAALSCTEICEADKYNYYQSYLYRERLAYIDRKNNSDKYIIRLYDNWKGEQILSTFKQIMTINIANKPEFLKIAAVRGFQFEEKVLQALCETIGVIAFDGTSEFKIELLKVCGAKSQLSYPCKYLVENQIIHLREGHTAIDGMLYSTNAKFVRNEETRPMNVLIFIQCSLKLYKDHTTKARAILGLAPKAENETKQDSIISYYRKLAQPQPISGALECLYLYVSPKGLNNDSPLSAFSADLNCVRTRSSSSESEEKFYCGFLDPHSNGAVIAKAIEISIPS